MRKGAGTGRAEGERYDPDRDRIATYIEWQKQGAWVVLWGPYTRRFWAFACWPLPEGGEAVSALDPTELYSEMRRVERERGFLQWRYGRRRSVQVEPASVEPA
ncbi:hypothetical protein [Nocardiopsis ansamitocini]|uniref:Uncharacterized protein n=1 Tax=Nocardiopsis ansamitocini TaxID=1670832 RepID=A0A9W6P8B7_9ACTN|nr:hypothetical protein [Nocardiopsis ansamitocini]GLU48912.1 hypothetical protein Nans01_32630 [Nocardiopsis ansamitocini]